MYSFDESCPRSSFTSFLFPPDFRVYCVVTRISYSLLYIPTETYRRCGVSCIKALIYKATHLTERCAHSLAPAPSARTHARDSRTRLHLLIEYRMPSDEHSAVDSVAVSRLVATYRPPPSPDSGISSIAAPAWMCHQRSRRFTRQYSTVQWVVMNSPNNSTPSSLVDFFVCPLCRHPYSNPKVSLVKPTNCN